MTPRHLDVPDPVLAAAARRGWRVEAVEGRAGELHHLDVSAERLVRVHHLAGPALVLGSTQPAAIARGEIAQRLGVEVARRRSGGGAVWLAPGEQVWVDVVVPAGDPLWHDDVGLAGHWLGAAWAALLPGAGVWRGAMVDRGLGRVACFAGMGPGEVSVAGRKVVGMSQRRTRTHARFQCVAYLRWDPAPLLGLLDLGASGPTPDPTAGMSAGSTAAGLGGRVAAALVDRVAPLPAFPGEGVAAAPAVWGVVGRLVDLLP